MTDIVLMAMSKKACLLIKKLKRKKNALNNIKKYLKKTKWRMFWNCLIHIMKG